MREILIASLFKTIKQDPYNQEKHIFTRHRNFWGMLQPKILILSLFKPIQLPTDTVPS